MLIRFGALEKQEQYSSLGMFTFLYYGNWWLYQPIVREYHRISGTIFIFHISPSADGNFIKRLEDYIFEYTDI
jgi:hypothetical protein